MPSSGLIAITPKLASELSSRPVSDEAFEVLNTKAVQGRDPEMNPRALSNLMMTLVNVERGPVGEGVDRSLLGVEEIEAEDEFIKLTINRPKIVRALAEDLAAQDTRALVEEVVRDDEVETVPERAPQPKSFLSRLFGSSSEPHKTPEVASPSEDSLMKTYDLTTAFYQDAAQNDHAVLIWMTP